MRTARLFALAILPVAAALLRPGAALRAQAGAPAPAKAQEYVTYQSGAAQWLSAPHTLEMSGGVVFGQDDATLKTDAAVALLDKDQNLLSARAEGPVHLYDSQDDLRGLHGTVDFTKHLATLTDGITLVVKPGRREAAAGPDSPRRQFKDPATLTCRLMTYNYRAKVGRIPGPLTVTQVIQTKSGPQTRTLTADAGLYNGKEQTIQLVGDVRGTGSDGSVIEGDTRPTNGSVVISIKEGAESLSVPFHTQGHFPVKPQADDGKDTADDAADLTLPVPPPSVKKAESAPVAAPAAPPASAGKP